MAHHVEGSGNRMTDEEMWLQAVAEVHEEWGAYPDRDVGKSVLVGLTVFICAVVAHLFTASSNGAAAALGTAALVATVHFTLSEYHRWGYRHRLRSSFWSIRTQEEIAAEARELF